MTGEEVTQDNLPVEDPQATEVPEAEQIPAWAVELRKQNEIVMEQLKVTQGQARRTEATTATLSNIIGSLAQAQKSGQELTPKQTSAFQAALARLDDSDPAVRSVKEAFTAYDETMTGKFAALEERVAQVSGHLQRQHISEQEMETRRHNAAALMDYADLAGVDIETVMKEINKLPTNEMWPEGRKLIRTKKAAKGNGNKEHIDALRESGKFGEQRRGAGGVAITDDASFLADYNAGKSKDHARAMKLTGYKP